MTNRIEPRGDTGECPEAGHGSSPANASGRRTTACAARHRIEAETTATEPTRRPALPAVSIRTAQAVAALALLVSPAAAQRDRVVPVLYLPADLPFDAVRLEMQTRAVRDAQAWYATRTGGFAFRADPLIVQRSRHSFAELAGNDFQNWWPLPAKEFADYGMPWNDSSHIKLLLLAQGAGAWAGADSENGGIEKAIEPGGLPRGALGGLAVIGDSSIAGILAGVCPSHGDASWSKPEGGTAWWCNWNTYRGTIAHELGHTFGLPHPDAFTPGFRCDSTVITNMQCHWAWPADSLLPFESSHLPGLPVFSRTAPDEWTPALPVARETAILRTLPTRDSPDSILWLGGRGGGTGYPHGYVVDGRTTVAMVQFPRADPSADLFVADIGLPHGATGPAEYRVRCAAARITGALRTGHPPATIELAVDAECAVVLEVHGLLGVGNPRWNRTPSPTTRDGLGRR